MRLSIVVGVIATILICKCVESCNEAICGSRVSKCLLTQSCQCDIQTCKCCKECFNCLGSLFDECCSCVDLCPKRNDSEGSGLSKKSSVEDFKEPEPELFSTLTELPDPSDFWSVVQYPVDIDVSLFDPKAHQIIYMRASDQSKRPNTKNVVTLNCTVAFMSQCLSINKCRRSCRSMGSSSYRWFHDGCCECIGQNCINYGINESRCRQCPEGKEIDKMEDYFDEYDFDEDDFLEDG